MYDVAAIELLSLKKDEDLKSENILLFRFANALSQY